MQVTHGIRRWVAAAGLASLVAAPARAQVVEPEPAAETLMRLFTDSEQVTVKSWMGTYALPLKGATGLSMHWNHERVTIPAIAAPAGSADAVDAITTASRPIAGNAFEDFVKVRNEFQGELTHGPAALQYYLSRESDYLGQQVAARWNRDLHDQLNLSLGTSWGWDRIEPLADDDTQTAADTRTTLHWNAVATQVVTATTLVRVGVEYNRVSGLQHNPYRNVYAGGTRVPERHPDLRQRGDAFVRVHQWLPNRSSVKFGYRLYGDDWGIASHELDTKLTQYLTDGVSVRWQYRWYTQTAAEFFRDEYDDASGVDGWRSGDYRVGPLRSHLFGAALHLDLESVAGSHPWLSRMGVWVDVDRYFNSNSYSANLVETGLDFRF